MVKLKKYRVKKEICDVCRGNGYVKVVHVDYKEHVHQCWECDSEGESYVYEASIYHNSNNTDKFLH